MQRCTPREVTYGSSAKEDAQEARELLEHEIDAFNAKIKTACEKTHGIDEACAKSHKDIGDNSKHDNRIKLERRPTIKFANKAFKVSSIEDVHNEKRPVSTKRDQ